jgi:hypothetical protein
VLLLLLLLLAVLGSEFLWDRRDGFRGTGENSEADLVESHAQTVVE